MNAEIKERWVEALKSGQYKRGAGALAQRNSGGTVEFCCLGVLCDLATQEGVVEINYSGDDDGVLWYGGHRSYLPSEVANWAEIETQNRHNPDINGVYLSDLNDSGKSFDEIADLIEENL